MLRTPCLSLISSDILPRPTASPPAPRRPSPSGCSPSVAVTWAVSAAALALLSAAWCRVPASASAAQRATSAGATAVHARGPAAGGSGLSHGMSIGNTVDGSPPPVGTHSWLAGCRCDWPLVALLPGLFVVPGHGLYRLARLRVAVARSGVEGVGV